MIFNLGGIFYVIETIIDRTFETITKSGEIKDREITAISFKNSGLDDAVINNVLTIKPGEGIIDFSSDLPAKDITRFTVRFTSNTGPRLEIIKTKIVGYKRKKVLEDAIVIPKN